MFYLPLPYLPSLNATLPMSDLYIHIFSSNMTSMSTAYPNVFIRYMGLVVRQGNIHF